MLTKFSVVILDKDLRFSKHVISVVRRLVISGGQFAVLESPETREQKNTWHTLHTSYVCLKICIFSRIVDLKTSREAATNTMGRNLYAS